MPSSLKKPEEEGPKSLEQPHQATPSSAQSPPSQPADKNDDEKEGEGEGEGETGSLADVLTQRHRGFYRQFMNQCCEK